eukprot:gene4179-4735_t
MKSMNENIHGQKLVTKINKNQRSEGIKAGRAGQSSCFGTKIRNKVAMDVDKEPYMLPMADILFSKGCEVLVIGFNSNQERGSLWSYSPHGSIGESFLKEEAGQYVVKLFKQCIEKKKASASIPAASTTQTSSTTIPAASTTQTSSTTIPAASTTQTSSTTIPAASTTQTSSTTIPAASTTQTSSTTIPAASTTQTSSTTIPAASTTQTSSTTIPAASTTQTSSTTIPAATTTQTSVSYIVDGQALAAGEEADSEGKEVPVGFVAVKICAVQNLRCPAPAPNSHDFLRVGEVYFLPKQNVFKYFQRLGKILLMKYD